MNANDYTSLDEFPLAWRFAPGRLTRAAGMVSRLRFLAPDAAARVARNGADPATLPGGDARMFRSDDSPGTVRASLGALPVDPASEVTLSWNSTTALRTDWSTFVAHWDDFCYPASDDVDIRPVGGRWALRYHHYEVFQFWPGTSTETGHA